MYVITGRTVKICQQEVKPLAAFLCVLQGVCCHGGGVGRILLVEPGSSPWAAGAPPPLALCLVDEHGAQASRRRSDL